MSRVCLRFELPIENTDRVNHLFSDRTDCTDGQIIFGGSVSVLSRRSRNENLYYRCCTDLSIGTGGEELFTDGKLSLPSVPSAPMDKVFEGYFMPLE